MKLSLKAKKPPLKTYQAWIAEKKAEQERTAKERLKLLPPDLAEQIMKAADRELADLEEQERAIHEQIAALQGELREARKRQRAACLPTNRPGAGQMSEAAAAVAKELNGIARAIRSCQFRLSDVARRKREVEAVRKAAERGVKTALLSIVESWKNRVVIGGLLPEPARMGRVWSDAAGNPLPPEALDPETGEPVVLAGREARP